MLVLLLGILSTGIIGIYTGTAFFDWFGAMGTGITGMGELIIITLAYWRHARDHPLQRRHRLVISG